MAFDRDALLAKVHAHGYWRVVLRPSAFDPKRIPSLGDCWETAEACTVSLRGWDYPHLDRRPELRANGSDWIASGADFMGNIEYWQLFQSGQFVHHFAFREDHEDGLGEMRSPGRPLVPFLDFVSILYSCTEIYEFAARLAGRGVLVPSAEIAINLMGTQDRLLSSWNPARQLSMNYVSSLPEITNEQTMPAEDLLARSSEFALDCALHLFERFGWLHASREMLAEDQRKLLERRWS